MFDNELFIDILFIEISYIITKEDSENIFEYIVCELHTLNISGRFIIEPTTLQVPREITCYIYEMIYLWCRFY
jgi:hypothetical protein